MSKPRKAGTQFETDVAAFMNINGFPTVERRVSRGNRDRGDIAGLPGWVLECKNEGRLDWAEWLNEARKEASNAGVAKYAVVAKRRRSAGSPGTTSEAYVCMPLWIFAALLADRGE